MNKLIYNPKDWGIYIKNIDHAIANMERIPIVSVGITPYTRIVPCFFLKNYSIYTTLRSSDVDALEKKVSIYALEDTHPELAKKVHSTSYLIGNHVFQNYIKSKIVTPQLMFYTMTEKISDDLERLRIPRLGNHPKTFETVKNKGPFRELLRELSLSVLESQTIKREDLFTKNFSDLRKEMQGSFVIQRADKEVGGNEGTFFVHQESDFNHCLEILEKDNDFSFISIMPFIKGHSVSMLGCVVPEGVLSGPLQLQLIDVPESLHGVPGNGIFFGNDVGFSDWNEKTEDEAQVVVEKIGEHLREQGYKGVFGIDFLYDSESQRLYANECNPRFTGSLLLYSLSLLEKKIPPMEFFHMAAHLEINLDYDFKTVKKALKTRGEYSHISFSPKGIFTMNKPFVAGVYNYNKKENCLSYKNQGICLADLKEPTDFLIIDTVPKQGVPIEQGVPRLFKFIFPRSIATSSYSIDDDAAFLVNNFSQVLLKN